MFPPIAERPSTIGRYRTQRQHCFALLPPNTKAAPHLHELMQTHTRLQIASKRQRAPPAPIGQLIGVSVSLSTGDK